MASHARAESVFACAALVPADALAQTSLQIPLQFNFLNPGAKSMALGGAFVALADDATATFANPGGLTQLDKPEVSIRRPLLAHGDAVPADRAPVRTDYKPGYRHDSGSVLRRQRRISGACISAVVYSSLATLRHCRVPARAGTGRPGVFVDGVFQKEPSQLGSQRDLPQDGHRQVDITGYGISGSDKVGPILAIGVSLTAYTFDMTSVFHRFNTVGFFGPANLDSVAGTATQNGDGTRWAPTLGLMAGRDARRFGVVYRRGATFDITTRDGNTPEQAGVFRCQTLWPSGRRSGADRLCSPLWK